MNFSLLYVRGETLWWDIDKCVKETVTKRIPTETNGISFTYESGFLFITLPSYRRLAYVKPRIGINKYGSEAVTYEGIGSTKKWERLESYGPKFCENIIQAIARDILLYAKYSLQGTTQSRYLTGGVPPVRFSI